MHINLHFRMYFVGREPKPSDQVTHDQPKMNSKPLPILSCPPVSSSPATPICPLSFPCQPHSLQPTPRKWWISYSSFKRHFPFKAFHALPSLHLPHVITDNTFTRLYPSFHPSIHPLNRKYHLPQFARQACCKYPRFFQSSSRSEWVLGISLLPAYSSGFRRSGCVTIVWSNWIDELHLFQADGICTMIMRFLITQRRIHLFITWD